MTLGELLKEIYEKDPTFCIVEPKNGRKVIISNRDDSIHVESDGLALSIERLWRLLYRGGMHATYRDKRTNSSG